jgi:signal transduction histidine kinase
VTDAARKQIPVSRFLSRKPHQGSRSSLSWRDRSIFFKLALAMLIPLLAATALGVVAVTDRVSRAGDAQRIDRLVTLNSAVHGVLEGLARERSQTAALLTQGVVGSSAELDQTRRDVDNAVNPFTAALSTAIESDARISASGGEATSQVDRLSALRGQVAASQLDTVQAITEYSTITTALIRLETAVSAGINDRAFGGTPTAFNDLDAIRDSLSQAQALGSYGIARGSLAPSELTALRTSTLLSQDRINDFRAVATADQNQAFDRGVGPALTSFATMAKTIVDGQGTQPRNPLRDMSPQQWLDTATSAITQTTQLSDQLGTEVRATSRDLVGGFVSGPVFLLILIVIVLVLAVLLAIFVIRRIRASLRALRTGVLDVADNQLPLAVRAIQEGKPQETEMLPVAVASKDEIGEVARAVDAVHAQALKLAVEQATIRAGYGSVFVNLSRRSQSLVQRQLQLIERLERDEEDADQLATLFQLDHLATRMRRNNENLMLLSGAEPSRRFGQPVTTADVLGAAISEIEQYQRVVVQNPPSVRVVGYAASDLMRLVAELLDNATSFSAPETQVTVATQLTEQGSLLIDILDKGIGMNESEVSEANLRLKEVGSLDLATSRRMGLFVVGRLAARQGIGVTLHGGKDIVGVRASVTVPSGLIMHSTSTTVERVYPAQSPSPLPRRNRAANAPAVNGKSAGTTGLSGAAEATSTEQPAAEVSSTEVSGTALFTPISADQDAVVSASPETERGGKDQHDRNQDAQLPSGKALFEANATVLTDWWTHEVSETPPRDQTTDVPAVSMGAEHTPIFDEMVSVWFRAPEQSDASPAKTVDTAEKTETENAKEAPQELGSEQLGSEQAAAEKDLSAEELTVKESSVDFAAAGTATAKDWDFANDARWRTVREVSQSAPAAFTEVGLPVRQRGEQLLPGSVIPPPPNSESRPKELPTRDPADIRGRLSSFQKGLHRGRRAQHALDTTEMDSASSATGESVSRQTDAGEQTGTGEQTAAAETAAVADVQQVTPSENPLPSRKDSDAWSFASDETSRRASSAIEARSSDTTESGLPRRRRGEQLMPGTVGTASSLSASSPSTTARPARDPRDVRGRLSSFQQGVRRGRHQATPVVETSDLGDKTTEGLDDVPQSEPSTKEGAP